MPATCNHARSYITTHPQPVRLHGERTTVELAITISAKCPHGHDHTLHVTDISDVEEAASRAGRWASGHVNNCPGPAVLAAA